MNPFLDANLCLASQVPLSEAGVVLFGVPFDSTSTYRSGSREAPYTIRREFLELEKEAEGGSFFDVAFHDAGNVDVVHGDLEATFERMRSVLASIRKANPRFLPVMLGGEHTLSYPVVESLAKESPDLVVVSLDAHLDCKQDYNGSAWNHSTVMHQVAELGVPVVVVGVRSYDEKELEHAQRLGVRWLGPDATAEEVTGLVGDAPLYLCVDCDVLDPGVAPGVANPEPGGPGFNNLRDIVSSVAASGRLCGLDLVEVSPPHDHGTASSVAAARLLLAAILSYHASHTP